LDSMLGTPSYVLEQRLLHQERERESQSERERERQREKRGRESTQRAAS
jgi:hypothetical protein